MIIAIEKKKKNIIKNKYNNKIESLQKEINIQIAAITKLDDEINSKKLKLESIKNNNNTNKDIDKIDKKIDKLIESYGFEKKDLL